MKRHRFTKWNRERISVYASAALIVGVCVASGVYATYEAPSKTQIIDMESVNENHLQDSGKKALADGDQNKAPTAEPTIPTSKTSKSPLPEASALAQEYAMGVRNEQPDLADSTDLTGDAEIEMEDVVIPTGATGKSKTKPMDLHFRLEDGMTWPVQGNVIISYSMDERAYLATLNEYRYYPAVAISAATDSTICAAAKGRVTNIGYNEEIGQYVTMDLGDGYEMTYGQLKDLTVEQGDYVSRGQIIGSVADPTKYYSVEGANLYVKMEHNKESMDPVLYFQ